MLHLHALESKGMPCCIARPGVNGDALLHLHALESKVVPVALHCIVKLQQSAQFPDVSPGVKGNALLHCMPPCCICMNNKPYTQQSLLPCQRHVEYHGAVIVLRFVKTLLIIAHCMS